jgi:hypothetical protein
MSDQPVCSQCNVPLTDRRIMITEDAADSSAVSSWTFCSWTCARERVIRFVRVGRDDR